MDGIDLAISNVLIHHPSAVLLLIGIIAGVKLTLDILKQRKKSGETVRTQPAAPDEPMFRQCPAHEDLVANVIEIKQVVSNTNDNIKEMKTHFEKYFDEVFTRLREAERAADKSLDKVISVEERMKTC
jgi:uncharacterized protein YqgV (UPF0045/DUF77 family)